jgi:hypothetical protein
VGDDRSLSELGRAIDDLRREVREDYVRRDVYLEARDADRARIRRLEDDDTSKATGNRAWLLSLAQLLIGAILGLVGSYLTAKGGH